MTTACGPFNSCYRDTVE